MNDCARVCVLFTVFRCAGHNEQLYYYYRFKMFRSSASHTRHSLSSNFDNEFKAH